MTISEQQFGFMPDAMFALRVLMEKLRGQMKFHVEKSVRDIPAVIFYWHHPYLTIPRDWSGHNRS